MHMLGVQLILTKTPLTLLSRCPSLSLFRSSLSSTDTIAYCSTAMAINTPATSYVLAPLIRLLTARQQWRSILLQRHMYVPTPPLLFLVPCSTRHFQACLNFENSLVARDKDLAEQIGRDIYFDLVDHDKVRKFRIRKQMPFNLFKEEVAKEFGIPVQFQRLWIWAKRQNHTYRPSRPLTPEEESQSVGQCSKVSNNMLELFLEVEFGPNLHPIPPPEKTNEDILLFFKLYDPEKQEIRFVGRLFVKKSSQPVDILAKLNQFGGFPLDEELEIYEEVKFEPVVMCYRIVKMSSFQSNLIGDGDIICFQKSTPPEMDKGCKYPDVPSFLNYVHNRRVVHFHSLEKPMEEGFCLELSKLHTYNDVVERLAQHIGLESPTKIRLTAHNCYSQQPMPQPIKYQGVEHLTEMLTHYNQVSGIALSFLCCFTLTLISSSDILYYEVLDIPLPELERLGLKTLKIAFHHATKDEVGIYSIILPKQSNVGDVINVLKTKVELSHPNAELRLLEVFDHKIYKIPEEEKNLGLDDILIHVYHFTKVTVLNQTVEVNYLTTATAKNFGKPFVLVIHGGETLAEVKIRIQKKLQVPDEEFSKWKFAFLSLGRPEYLQDSDIVSSRFQRRDVYGAWEQYLGLEHSDKAPKRAHAANQAAQETLESMASNVGNVTASREMQNGELDGPPSPAVDGTLRRLSAAEDLVKSTSAREPSVEALAALDTVSRYARSSLDTLSTNGAYEEFKAAVKLLTEQGMIHSTITSMLKDLLSSLEGEMPKYVAAVKELAQAENFAVEHEDIKVKMGLAMQTCQERKDIVANYDAKVTELEAELARVNAQLAQVKAERAEAMANLETAVDEMEPHKQRFADSSLKSENLIVRQATLTLQNCGSVGIWAVLQDVLKKYFKF
ncbi:unnamed protein product [Malus baccata var. baccata]